MNRPPKKWWYDTVKILSRIKRISNPAKAAGWLWYHRLSPAQKIKKLTKKDLQKELLKYYTGIGHNSTCTKYTENTSRKSAMKKKHQKKKISAKQKKSLKAGRKVLSYLRTGRKVSPAKEPIIIKEGYFMAAKKHRKKGKHVKHVIYGKPGGMEGRKKRRHGKRSYLHGDMGGFDALNLGIDLIGGILGAVIGSATAGLVPIKNQYLKALVPLAIGGTLVSIPQLSKIRFMHRTGLGSFFIGGYAMVKAAFPKIPLMAGVEDAEGIGRAIDALPEEEKALLGIAPENQIEYHEAGGDTQYTGSQPGEMLGTQPGEMLGAEPGDMLGTEPGEMLGDAQYVTQGESEFD